MTKVTNTLPKNPRKTYAVSLVARYRRELEARNEAAAAANEAVAIWAANEAAAETDQDRLAA